ncbi:MAG: hypothetical protein A4E69_01048 [Syntrophus sp. PtaB.Bin138]|nr:hypothetical protein [Geobacteraceae bacterium]OPY14665.1 MAG: hypothetical protein A4E69_01048 [Syntrophus sp. PtaB.Bin138]
MIPNMPAVLLGDDRAQRKKLKGIREAWAVAMQHDITPFELYMMVQDRYAMIVHKERVDEEVFPYPDCLECAHVQPQAPPRLYCWAPQVNDVIEALPNGEYPFIDCESVRLFKAGCGREARWFHKRYLCHYSWHSEEWATAGPEESK